MASRTAGIPVRGICKAGHVTETTSAAGRLTWNGECSDPGCQLQVYARRIPRDATPPPPPVDQGAGTTRVVRIASYDDTASGAQDDPGGFVVADTGDHPADEPEPSTGGGGADVRGPVDQPDPIDQQHRPSWTRRMAERQRARRIRSARRGFQHPLVPGL